MPLQSSLQHIPLNPLIITAMAITNIYISVPSFTKLEILDLKVQSATQTW